MDLIIYLTVLFALLAGLGLGFTFTIVYFSWSILHQIKKLLKSIEVEKSDIEKAIKTDKKDSKL